MKKIIKKILIAIGILIFAVIILFAGVFLKLRSELNKMTPMETSRITDEIYVIRDSIVNAYLFRIDKGYIMIDAGTDKAVIKRELIALSIDSGDIKAVFLTHSDYDHAGSLPLFQHAEIYLSKQEEQMITGEHRRMLFQYNEIATEDYNLLEDNQEINFSEVSVRGISTPGHTPGAMCYLINDRFLFTGDALSLKDGRVDEFMKLATMDRETHRKSIGKLSRLENIDYIFTAHYGMSDDFEFAFSGWTFEK
jgi:glyoxylase-like metal-dependent hydrolase (beta-lactamase superfamily II)